MHVIEKQFLLDLALRVTFAQKKHAKDESTSNVLADEHFGFRASSLKQKYFEGIASAEGASEQI